MSSLFGWLDEPPAVRLWIKCASSRRFYVSYEYGYKDRIETCEPIPYIPIPGTYI